MIPQALEGNFRRLSTMPVQIITDSLLHIHYPRLMHDLRCIEEYFHACNENLAVTSAAMAAAIRQELHSMICKEEQILFPLLHILEQKQRRSDCAPFKLVRKHADSMLTLVRQLQKHLASEPITIQEQLKHFEDHITLLQRAKEKHLLNRFKRCNASCKINADEQRK